jgi:6-pyruvoyltetrahydropterin/6-carboxytetrahydropterin synthase
MTLLRITKEFHFCAGHRLWQYKGKCRNLHGHNYVARVTVKGPHDVLGMVIDFDTLKGTVGKWIDEHWDHAMLLNEDDMVARSAMAQFADGQRVYLTVGNPTAECMARTLAKVTDALLTDKAPADVSLVRVEVQETPNCSAEVDWP